MDTSSRITGATRLMGVIGSYLDHSSSPEIHNAVFGKNSDGIMPTFRWMFQRKT